MKNVLVDILRAERSISGYRITDSKTESYELFFVHRSLETVRATDTGETSVTVYVEHDGKLGDATFSVYGSMSDEEIKEKIAAAAERAKLVFNEPYELPGITNLNPTSAATSRACLPQRSPMRCLMPTALRAAR